uniref:Uncharacterized protein n=1 Tax=Molossus molossus TaxID=27622 RepID=A0A7J8HCT2_MOLMO|nr:hypothetical protein HJG59_011219 [Molossus molossus]
MSLRCRSVSSHLVLFPDKCRGSPFLDRQHPKWVACGLTAEGWGGGRGGVGSMNRRSSNSGRPWSVKVLRNIVRARCSVAFLNCDRLGSCTRPFFPNSVLLNSANRTVLLGGGGGVGCRAGGRGAAGEGGLQNEQL